MPITRIDRSNWSMIPAEFKKFRRRALTSAVPLKVEDDAQCVVETQEGAIVLQAGWRGMIAIDSKGFPYPISEQTFADTYEPAEE